MSYHQINMDLVFSFGNFIAEMECLALGFLRYGLLFAMVKDHKLGPGDWCETPYESTKI
ncbi:MAG: hypothetical protein WKF36_11440 [Candidatus Nitrosocosmicus sp.]